MTKVVLLLLSLCVPLFAQTPGLDAYFRGIEVRRQVLRQVRRQEQLDRAAEEQRQIENSFERTRLELERQRLELEKRRQSTPARSPQPLAAQKQEGTLEVNQAMLVLAIRYPDFPDYADALTDLSSIFSPGNSSGFTVERYLEGLYLIAKHTSPSQGSDSKLPRITLAVTSDPPSAEILVNGKFVGSTPTTRSLDPGEYSVEVSKKGFKSWIRSVDLKSGDSVTLHAELPNVQAQPPAQNQSTATDQPTPITKHGLPKH